MNGHDGESAWVEHTLVRLGESRFRAKFVLSEADRSYARDKGRCVIDRHAHEMLRARVGEAQPSNDGRQTPGAGIQCSPPSMRRRPAAADASRNGMALPRVVR